MINIETNTLIIKGYGYESVFLDVIDFFDLEGKNVLFVSDVKSEQNNNLLRFFSGCKKVNFKGDNYKEVIKSNLYNIDIIVINTTSWLLRPVKEYIETLKIPAIYIKPGEITKNPAVNDTKLNFDNIYEMYIIREPLVNISDILDRKDVKMIKDINNNWECSIDDLKLKYIRDKKIGDILD